jgi:lipid A disaccharide synthetase
MIVMYDAGRLLHWPYRVAGRFVIRLPHLSLVNILSGARVVPEFMPFIRDLAPVADVARQLLRDETWRTVMVNQLDELVRPLEDSRASENVCAMMADMLRGAGAPAPAAQHAPVD